MDEQGQRLFATDPKTNQVYVFDTVSGRVLHYMPVHPNSLALSPGGQTLYVTVKATRDKTHPAWREDARDSLVRIDLG